MAMVFKVLPPRSSAADGIQRLLELVREDVPYPADDAWVAPLITQILNDLGRYPEMLRSSVRSALEALRDRPFDELDDMVIGAILVDAEAALVALWPYAEQLTDLSID